jgi:hypothetical protein
MNSNETDGARLNRLSAFVARVANLTKDQECPNCSRDGGEENVSCGPLEDERETDGDAGHYAFDMPNDHAVETLHCTIDEARELMKGLPK